MDIYMYIIIGDRLLCKGQRDLEREGTDLYCTQLQIKSMHVLLGREGHGYIIEVNT